MRWVARSAAFPSLTAHAPRVTPLPLQIKDWSELDRVAGLPELQEVLFVGNPIYDGMDRKTAKLHVRRERGPAPRRASPTPPPSPQVLKRLPRLVKIDNEMVIDAEREAAARL